MSQENESAAQQKSSTIRLAGLWTGQTKDGETYLSGSPAKGAAHTYAVYKNKFKKEGSNEPDYNLVLLERKFDKAADGAAKEEFTAG